MSAAKEISPGLMETTKNNEMQNQNLKSINCVFN